MEGGGLGAVEMFLDGSIFAAGDGVKIGSGLLSMVLVVPEELATDERVLTIGVKLSSSGAGFRA